MAYRCPRCGEPIKRDTSPEARESGLVGILFLFSAAFGTFKCPYCGWIELREFPSEVRAKIILTSILMVIGAIGLLIAWYLALE